MQYNWCNFCRAVTVKCFAQEQLRLFSHCSCFFVFPAGEGEAEVQTVLHTGRPAQHRGWRSGSVSPSRAVGESMTLGHCQRLCDRTRKGSHRTGMNVTWGGTHMLSTGDVQLCLHVLTTLLVALVQNVLPHAEGVLGHFCQA